MDVSVIVPIHNEVENIARLHAAVSAALARTEWNFELVLVDDGSNDGSCEALRQLAETDPRVCVIELRRNFGQSAAMLAGIRESRGEIVVTLDGDLQNDPADIPRLIDKLREDMTWCMVGGAIAKIVGFIRKLPSLLANRLISRVTHFPVRDLGCTLKAMKREIALELELYGEMHRFIPILAALRGARCVEIEVQHHPRLFGKTKYGLDRTLRVLLDLATVAYLQRYLAAPMQWFGRWALAAAAVSAVLLSTCLVRGVAAGEWPISPLAGGLVALVAAAQFLGLGLIAETASRIYLAGRQESVYAIRDRRGRTLTVESEVRRKAG